MSKFFAKFPKITYPQGRNNIVLTNLLFRVKVINGLKNNIFSYLDFKVPENDSIEIVAEKYYGDPEAHWVIILANDFTDPLYDWPLKYNDFNNYLVNKYGSVENAQEQIHHYEQVKTYRSGQPPVDNIITTIIDQSTYDSLPENSYQAFNFSNGSTVQEIITKSVVSCYDYENNTNEAKRNIKLIKKDYYDQIMQEFNNLTTTSSPTLPFIRSLKNF